MLDRLFLKYLTKKGKIAYWVGQLLLSAIWGFYVFGVAGYTYVSNHYTTEFETKSYYKI
jgi:hypothetical protein